MIIPARYLLANIKDRQSCLSARPLEVARVSKLCKNDDKIEFRNPEEDKQQS